MTLIAETPLTGPVLAGYSTSMSSNGSVITMLSPFVLGIIVFVVIYGGSYLYYRNTDKKYEFEAETRISVANVQAFDRALRRRNGVRDSSIDGRNSHSPRERVRRIPIS